MKVKVIRKKDTKEFIEIDFVDGKMMVFVSDIPHLLSSELTEVEFKKFIGDELSELIDDIELVDYELIESENIN